MTNESCAAGGGLVFDATGTGAWSFNASSYNATTDVVHGRLTNVAIHWASSDGQFCIFDAVGWLNADYRNATQVLVPGDGQLIISKPNPQGCAGGLFDTGDHLDFVHGGLSVSAPAGSSPVTIRPAA